MSQISAKVRLRPIRFAFLVRPDDELRVRQIFEINTCLWGGKFNPVIPYFKRVPRWWDRHSLRSEPAARIINGYLDFFEPDFVVESEVGMSGPLGFGEKRVLQLSDVLAKVGDDISKGYGLNVTDLYSDLYKKTFQFVRREPHDIIDLSIREKAFRTFGACVFGAFPKEKELRYIGESFTKVFEPMVHELSAKALAKLYENRFTSPLRLGHVKIKADYHGMHDSELFVLDATKPADLIDYWNLRATRRNVVPIPIQWLSELSEFAKKFIVDCFRPLRGNPNGVMVRATVSYARSISSDLIDQSYKDHLKVDVNGANVRRDWYPTFWIPSPGFTQREMRVTLSAEKKSFDLPIGTDSNRVAFDCLAPEFASEYGNKIRWANVVRLDDWTFKDQLATVFPCEYKNPKFPKFRSAHDLILPTTEGLVSFPQFRNIGHHWEIPTGAEAIQSWLKANGIESSPSDAGRATTQIIQTVGGLQLVRSFAHPAIVELLNEMSRKQTSKSMHHQIFRNRINDSVKGDIWRGREFEHLVECRAVDLGLQVRCTKCSSWSWFSLKQLDYQLTCDLCLRQFSFPISAPTVRDNSHWSYRLIGPFALPDYARGGYSASLSIRFFSEIVSGFDRSAITWAAGQELELAPNQKVEADFVLWYQRKQMFGNDYPTDIVFGEAKSFGNDAFKADDVARMQTLAKKFPGSIIVFATMKKKEDLSVDEVFHIRKLAEWGRQYIRDRRQTLAPVIILTSTELFTSYSLGDSWKEMGGKHAQFSDHAFYFKDNLRALADMTQQLYLGMPSYGDALRAKWDKRAARQPNKG